MADELMDSKLYGIGHNYQRVAKFPQGMLSPFKPPRMSGANETDQAKAAYKSVTSAIK